jgi:uncharacterized membrane protein SpoIIM required for sporulation
VNDAANTPWSVQFRRERQVAWIELEALVSRCERDGLQSLGAERIARLPVLYRAALSSLGVARSSVLDQGLRDHLESLVARAYLVVYSPKRGFLEVLVPFVVSGFPSAVRSIRWHVLASALLLLLGGWLAFAMVQADAEQYYLFVDSGMASGRDPTASTESLRATLFHGDDDRGLLTFAAFLFTHNSSVGILTYGLGFVLGLPVMLMLLFNGMLLGAMTALFHDRGLAVEWWSWVLPHGVTELLAIVLCGAAGLAVGQQVVFPGVHAREHGRMQVGRRMGAVVAGSVAMLLLAGLTEGVFRQIVHSLPVRYTMAAVFAAIWVAYFSLSGRSRT